ncbi:MAG: DedA family protein [Thermoleophilia bacterium]|jgi:membrane protein DedA with SNARE-associated domain|nr:DedA family protein [Thermoleophilia bacterium]
MVAECVFPPIPSEAVLPLAGFSVSQGTLEFVGVLLVATAGSLVGALLLYALGRLGGRPLVLRYHRVLRITDADIDKAERWFARWGDWVVLGARVVPLARSIVSIPAGLAQMGLVRFSLLTALGSLVWNAALISAGWALEDNWRRVADLVGTAGLVVLVVLVVAVVAVAWWWWRRRARPRPGASSR